MLPVLLTLGMFAFVLAINAISTFSKAVQTADLGATKGTFESVGTVTLRGDARKVLAILVLMVNSAGTTSEAYCGEIKVTANDLGISGEKFVVGAANEGGVATNSSAKAWCADLIPVDWDCKGGEDILIEFSSLNSLTTGFNVTASVLYSNGNVPSRVRDAIDNFSKIRGDGGNSQANSDIKATTRTVLSSTTMRVPSWADALVGVRPIIVPDALATADEPFTGYMELVSTLGNFAPQEFPFLNGQGASDGTAPAIQGWPLIKEWPVWIPMGEKAEDVDAYSNPLAAASGAIVGICGIRYNGKPNR